MDFYGLSGSQSSERKREREKILAFVIPSFSYQRTAAWLTVDKGLMGCCDGEDSLPTTLRFAPDTPRSFVPCFQGFLQTIIKEEWSQKHLCLLYTHFSNKSPTHLSLRSQKRAFSNRETTRGVTPSKWSAAAHSGGRLVRWDRMQWDLMGFAPRWLPNHTCFTASARCLALGFLAPIILKD